MKMGFNLALALALALGFSLTGCSTFKGGKEQPPQATPSKKHHKAKHVKPKAKHPAAVKKAPPSPSKPAQQEMKTLPGKLNLTIFFQDTALYKNRPVSGATVIVSAKQGGAAGHPKRAKTSASGECSLELEAGDYDIMIIYSRTQKHQPVHIRNGRTRSMTITFP